MTDFLNGVIKGEKMMPKSELCEKCAHTKVCFKDKNLFGDVFIAGNPMIFDNDKLYEKFLEREKRGFPCDDFLSIEEPICPNCGAKMEKKSNEID